MAPVILLQETLFIWQRSKCKFLTTWAILSHDAQMGPKLDFYEDITAKRRLIDSLPLARMAENIRFGSTALSNLDASLMDGIGPFGKDPRADNHLLIAFLTVPDEKPNGGISRKAQKASAAGNQSIWLCSTSLHRFYEFIKMLSNSLITLGLLAPEPSQLENPNTLHNYKPVPFVPRNQWELFWDNPTPFVSPKAESLSAASTLNIGSRGRADILHTFGSTDENSTSPLFMGSQKHQKKAHRGSIKLPSLDIDDKQPIPILWRVRELPELPFQATKITDLPNMKKPDEMPTRNGNNMVIIKVFNGMTNGLQHQQLQQDTNTYANHEEVHLQSQISHDSNEITVIQLLDNAIDEAGRPMKLPAAAAPPRPPMPSPRQQKRSSLAAKDYMDAAEVQTEQTMTSAENAGGNFWPYLIATATANAGEGGGGGGGMQQMTRMKRAASVNDAAADGGDCGGGIYNNKRADSSCYASSYSDFDEQPPPPEGTAGVNNGMFMVGQPAGEAPRMEVQNMEEIGIDTRFYQVQLTESSQNGQQKRSDEEVTQF